MVTACFLVLALVVRRLGCEAQTSAPRDERWAWLELTTFALGIAVLGVLLTNGLVPNPGGSP